MTEDKPPPEDQGECVSRNIEQHVVMPAGTWCDTHKRPIDTCVLKAGKPRPSPTGEEVEGVVARLNEELSKWGHPLECDGLMREAASLLTSISKERDFWKGLLTTDEDSCHRQLYAAKAENEALHATCVAESKRMADLMAENEALREALVDLLRHHEEFSEHMGHPAKNLQCTKQARTALGGE